jgi:transcriptional regulator with XRE-family HTH domain
MKSPLPGLEVTTKMATLKEIRLELGFNRQKLARLSDTSPGTIRNMEAGRTVRPETFGAVSTALGMTTAELRAALEREPTPA